MINSIDIDNDNDNDNDGIIVERFDASTAVSGVLVPGLGSTNC